MGFGSASEAHVMPALLLIERRKGRRGTALVPAAKGTHEECP